MKGAYYNEWEPYPAQWLRNLIKANIIAPGDVDERSIKDVKAEDLKDYTQCHFFAGIGGWSYALRRAGWPDTKPVWTGSCPCQPFSGAGKKRSFLDERHLWPEFFRLIHLKKPPICFGEQVASPAGMDWLDHVCADMENENYAVGAADLCAAGVGAGQIRQRLYWMAYALGGPAAGRESGSTRCGGPDFREQEKETKRSSSTDSLGGLICCDSDIQWLPSPDGKQRPIKSGLCLLADGIPFRTLQTRAYGNAIVPQVAQAFIEACMKVRP